MDTQTRTLPTSASAPTGTDAPGAEVFHGPDASASAGAAAVARLGTEPPDSAPSDAAPWDAAPLETAPPDTAPAEGDGGDGNLGGGASGGGAGDGDVPGATPPPPPPGPAGAHGRELVRPHHGRMLGGVAAAFAAYFDVDVLLVRIVFVVLAVVTGIGILAYLVAWALIPAEHASGGGSAHDGNSTEPGTEGRRRRSRLLVVAVAFLAGLALLDVGANGPWWPHRSWNLAPGFWLFFGALVFLIVLVARGPGDSAGARLRRLLLALVVAGVALVVVAVASVLTAVAVTGVPLRGGIGDSRWQPTSPAQVSHAYHLAAGHLEVDLRDVTFGPGTTHLTATVGVGQVQVVVPAGPTVTIVAHSGIGDVWVFGTDNSGIGPTRSLVASGAAQGTLVLNVQAGIGQVRVVRAGPTTAVPDAPSAPAAPPAPATQVAPVQMAPAA
jgi:phage shock protein PspC (stress-responsive transcriptional regulator)